MQPLELLALASRASFYANREKGTISSDLEHSCARTLIPLSEDSWDNCMHGPIMKTHCSCNISVLLFNIWYIWSNVYTMQTKKWINLFNQSQSRNIVNTMDLLYLITSLPFRRGTTILIFVYYHSDKDIKSFVTYFKTHITLLPSF